MCIMFDLNNVVTLSQQINVYSDGNVFKCYPDETAYNEIISSWTDMTKGAHEMPAYGVSLDRETRKVMQSGVWVEFVFGQKLEYNGMPFENLLINVEKNFCGFNLIRYTAEHGYDGRCFYLDILNKNMDSFYNILLNLK